MIARIAAVGLAAWIGVTSVPMAWALESGNDGAPATQVIDDFDMPIAWTQHPADGVEMSLRSDAGFAGKAMRMDFAFSGGGWAIARREVALDLPENYEFRFRLRGEAKTNHLEFKLVDASGENVWWSVRRDMTFPQEWETVAIKKRHISYAWGPLGGGDMRHVAAIEIVVTAGEGGSGSVWIDDFTLRDLPLPNARTPMPRATASSARMGREARRALDGKRETSWAPRPEDTAPWIELDLGGVREFGGLVLEWQPEHSASEYEVAISEDGDEWRTVWHAVGANGGRDPLFLPESAARFVRLTPRKPAGDAGTTHRTPPDSPPLALAEIDVRPLAFGASREAFFEAIAVESPHGTYPRGMSGEQVYWTVVGADGDPRECLLSEDGALETGRGAFSVEPILFVDGAPIGWADVHALQSLEKGHFPIPTVTWETDGLRLDVTAFDAGMRDSSAVVARYRVTNTSGSRKSARLILALRPFQVNPPSQALNLRGGTAPIRELSIESRAAIVNGRPAVRFLHPWSSAGAAAFGAGDIVADHVSLGRLPASTQASDALGFASGAVSYELVLEPGASRTIGIVVPLSDAFRVPEDPGGPGVENWNDWVQAALEDSRARWARRTGSIEFDVPPSVQPWVDLFRAQISSILVNRAGPAIQPGTRSYARSWIRDGSLTSSALLRAGMDDVVREFLEWYAPFQFENGKIPCVVDERGADPVPEHDSSGEFIFLVAEMVRFTGDTELARTMWPRVERAAAYLDSLRLTTKTTAPDSLHFDGLLPPSISHEGYSAKPMHSYWDDFFAVRGFRDAAYLAGVLGLEEERVRWERVDAEFSADVHRSIERAMALHSIDYVPGCADLGDFDATSTTIALSPCAADASGKGGGEPAVSTEDLERTFERYWTFFRERRDQDDWDAYTPYEIRNVGAFVRLGWRDRAHELLDFFAEHRRPIGWNQWPEVVVRDVRAPRFLGDLPHGWVGSDFMRSFLEGFAYARGDGTLVVGAGIPESWLDEGSVEVWGLESPNGYVHLSIWREGDENVVSVGADPGTPVEVQLAGGSVTLLTDVFPTTVRIPRAKRVGPSPLDDLYLREASRRRR